MTGVEQLSREQLLAVVAQQAAVIAEQTARVAEQNARIEELATQVEELTRKLNQNSGDLLAAAVGGSVRQAEAGPPSGCGT